ncbi:hypothetical protein KBC51_01930 [Candidatus Saccharibacteria bacterium]|jgi:hypothetical protein|nr:hypothetical protein [Candidatus Saccharibacteria bacterium]
MAKKMRKSASKSLPQENAQTIESLKAELISLQTEINQLKSSKRSSYKNFFRRFTVVFLVTLSLVFLFSLNVSYWVKQNVLDTDTFVATTSPIIQDPAVQDAIANQITFQIFNNVNVEQRLAENLPENIQFLAPTLATQIENVTKSQIGNLLNTNEASAIWTGVLTKGQSSVIAFIENPNNNGTITVDELYGFLGQRTNDSKVSFIFNKQLPPKFGQIQLREVKWLPEARAYLNVINRAPQLLSLAFVVSLVGAIMLSRQKLKTALIATLLLTVTMLVSLWLISFGATEISNVVKPENKEAVVSIYNIITTGLISQTTGLAWLFGAFSLAILFNLNIKPVVGLKKSLRSGLDKINTYIFPKFVAPNWLKQIETNSTIIMLVTSSVWFVALALRIPPTKNGVIAAIWSTLATVVIIEILSSVARTHKK